MVANSIDGSPELWDLERRKRICCCFIWNLLKVSCVPGSMQKIHMGRDTFVLLKALSQKQRQTYVGSGIHRRSGASTNTLKLQKKGCIHMYSFIHSYLLWVRPCLRISELKWTEMGKFNWDDYFIYYCGQESHRKNGIVLIINKRVWKFEMQYLGATSKMTGWSRVVSKASHSTSQ